MVTASWSVRSGLGFTVRLRCKFWLAFGYGSCERFSQWLRSCAFRVSAWFIFTLTTSCRHTRATRPKFSASRGRSRFRFQTWRSWTYSVCWIDLYKLIVTIPPWYFFRFLLLIFFDRVHRLKFEVLSSVHRGNVRDKITLDWQLFLCLNRRVGQCWRWTNVPHTIQSCISFR